MKKIFVKDLSKYLEKEISEVFFLEKINQTSSDGRKWLDICLTDISGQMLGKCWSENMKEEYFKYIGMIVRVTGKVEFFRDLYGMRISDIRPASENEYERSEFRIGISNAEKERLTRRLSELIGSVTDKKYQALLSGVFTPGKLKKFQVLPGEKQYHHTYDGAWLRHAIEVVELSLSALQICEGSPIERVKVNKDLLITGALLHDVGRFNSFKDTSIEPMLSNRGKLVGQVHDGAIFISCINNSLPNEYKVEDMSQLIHIVVSAHKGADIRPMTKEAVIVAQSDILSSSFDAVDCLFYDYERKKPEDAGRLQAFSNYFDTEILRPRKGGGSNV